MFHIEIKENFKIIGEFIKEIFLEKNYINKN